MVEVVASSRYRFHGPTALRLIVTDFGVRAVQSIRTNREERRGFLAVLKADPCAYCGGPGGERDHVVTRLVAGGHTGLRKSAAEMDNLTGSCASCNSAKRAKPLLGFLLDRLG